MIDEPIIQQLQGLLLRAENEPYPIALLTDEELIAIEHTEATTPHPLPWVDSLAGVDHKLAGEFGARSLLTRGLIRNQAASSANPPELDVPPELRIVLDTRRVGLGYVRALRPRGEAGASKIMVVQPELGVFEEEITDRGFHLFTACTYADSTIRLASWTVPENVVRVSGSAIELPARQWPEFLLEELPGMQVSDLTIEVYLPEPGGRHEPEQWTVAYSDAMALLATPLHGERLAVSPITAGRLRDLLDDRIREALHYAQDFRSA